MRESGWALFAVALDNAPPYKVQYYKEGSPTEVICTYLGCQALSI